MKSRNLLIQLIEYVDVFEKQNQHLEDYSIDEFMAFMRAKIYDDKVNADVGVHVNRPVMQQDFTVILSRMIGLIYRYAKEYTKMALSGSALQTVEEFSFLIVLTQYESLSKTELIQKNVMPKTSGTEVVKRLLKKKLIRQFDDENDRRSQLVAVTETGAAELGKVFPKMRMASEIITGNLSIQEQQTLSFLLEKLDAWHNNLFINHKDAGLEELIQLKE